MQDAATIIDFTDGYEHNAVAIAHRPLSSTEIASAFAASILRNRQEAGRVSGCWPPRPVPDQRTGRDLHEGTSRRNGDVPRDNPLSFAASAPVSALHTDGLYHIVGYDASKKFGGSVAYRFLQAERSPKEESTAYFSASYAASGLVGLQSQSGKKRWVDLGAGDRSKPGNGGRDFATGKRSLAHSADHRLAAKSIKSSYFKSIEGSRSWEPRIIFTLFILGELLRAA